MIYIKKFNETKRALTPEILKKYNRGDDMAKKLLRSVYDFDKFDKKYKAKAKQPSPPKTEEETLLDKIKSFCTRSNFTNIDNGVGRPPYKINQDKSISIEGDVWNFPMPKGETRIPFKFDRISGNFSCSNKGLTTLENAPNFVGKNFDCTYNKLKTLLGGPNHVMGDYIMDCNKLTDLYGFPKFFNGEVGYKGNPIENILNMVPGTLDDNHPYDPELSKKEYMGRFINLLNEYQVIRGNKIVYSRLLDVFGDLNINFKGYENI